MPDEVLTDQFQNQAAPTQLNQGWGGLTPEQQLEFEQVKDDLHKQQAMQRHISNLNDDQLDMAILSEFNDLRNQNEQRIQQRIEADPFKATRDKNLSPGERFGSSIAHHAKVLEDESYRKKFQKAARGKTAVYKMRTGGGQAGYKDYWISRLPFAGGWWDRRTEDQKRQMLENIASGKASQQDIDMLGMYIARDQHRAKPKGFLRDMGEITSRFPGFMAEIAASGPAYKAGAGLFQKGVIAGAKKIGGKRAGTALVTRGVGTLGGTVVGTGVAAMHPAHWGMLAKSIAEENVPEWEYDPVAGGGFEIDLKEHTHSIGMRRYRGMIDGLIELWSERMGGHLVAGAAAPFKKLASALPKRHLQEVGTAVVGSALREAGKKGPGAVGRFIRKGGYHGWKEEVGEEYLGEYVRSLSFTLDQDPHMSRVTMDFIKNPMDEDARNTFWRDVGPMIASFALLGSGTSAIDAYRGRGQPMPVDIPEDTPLQRELDAAEEATGGLAARYSGKVLDILENTPGGERYDRVKERLIKDINAASSGTLSRKQAKQIKWPGSERTLYDMLPSAKERKDFADELQARIHPESVTGVAFAASLVDADVKAAETEAVPAAEEAAIQEVAPVEPAPVQAAPVVKESKAAPLYEEFNIPQNPTPAQMLGVKEGESDIDVINERHEELHEQVKMISLGPDDKRSGQSEELLNELMDAKIYMVGAAEQPAVQETPLIGKVGQAKIDEIAAAKKAAAEPTPVTETTPAAGAPTVAKPAFSEAEYEGQKVDGRELEADVWDDVSTGQPVEVKVFQGTGREDAGEVYTAGAAGPALGEAQYSAMNRREAEDFGPNIEERTVALQNPYVIKSDADLRELSGEESLPTTIEGWNKVLPKVRAELEKRGHDGAVINVLQYRDSDEARGIEGTKRLREVFEHSQIVEFAEPTPTAEAPAAEADVLSEDAKRLLDNDLVLYDIHEGHRLSQEELKSVTNNAELNRMATEALKREPGPRRERFVAKLKTRLGRRIQARSQEERDVLAQIDHLEDVSAGSPTEAQMKEMVRLRRKLQQLKSKKAPKKPAPAVTEAVEEEAPRTSTHKGSVYTFKDGQWVKNKTGNATKSETIIAALEKAAEAPAAEITPAAPKAAEREEYTDRSGKPLMIGGKPLRAGDTLIFSYPRPMPGDRLDGEKVPFKVAAAWEEIGSKGSFIQIKPSIEGSSADERLLVLGRRLVSEHEVIRPVKEAPAAPKAAAFNLDAEMKQRGFGATKRKSVRKKFPQVQGKSDTEKRAWLDKFTDYKGAPQGKPEVKTKYTEGSLLEDPRDVVDTEGYAEAQSVMEEAGASLDKQSESGSQYYSLPDGTLARVSDHAPNAATKNWMENNDVADLRTDDMAGIVKFTEAPAATKAAEKPKIKGKVMPAAEQKKDKPVSRSNYLKGLHVSGQIVQLSEDGKIEVGPSQEFDGLVVEEDARTVTLEDGTVVDRGHIESWREGPDGKPQDFPLDGGIMRFDFGIEGIAKGWEQLMDWYAGWVKTQEGRTFRKTFRPGGILGKEAHTQVIMDMGKVKADIQRMNFLTKDLAKALKASAWKSKSLSKLSPDTAVHNKRREAMNTLLQTPPEEIAEKAKELNVPPKVAEILRGMREKVDSLSDEMVEMLRAQGESSEDFKEEFGDNLINVIIGNKGFYLTRMYKVFDQATWGKQLRKERPTVKLGDREVDLLDEFKKQLAVYDLLHRQEKYAKKTFEGLMKKHTKPGGTFAKRKADNKKLPKGERFSAEELKGEFSATRQQEFAKAVEKAKEKTKPATDAQLEGTINKILSPERAKGGPLFTAMGRADVALFAARKLGRGEFHQLYRKVLGEYDDKLDAAMRTVRRMSTTLATFQAQQSLIDINDTLSEEDKWFIDADREEGEFIRQIPNTAAMGPLAGKWAKLGFFQGLDQTFGRTGSVPYNMNEVGSILMYKMYAPVMGYARAAKTIYSLRTQVRNFAANASIAFSAGHLFNLRGTFGDSARAVKVNLFKGDNPREIDKKKAREFVAYMNELGVLGDTAGIGEIVDMIQGSHGLSAQEFLYRGPDHEEAGKIQKGQAWVKRGLRKTTQFASGFYQAGDEYWKIKGWLDNKAMLKEAYPKGSREWKKTGVSDAEREAWLDKEAAKRVRDQYPTYSMSPDAVRFMRWWPATGTFPTWWGEFLRTQYYEIPRQAMADIKSGNPRLALHGYSTMSRLAFANFGLGWTMKFGMGLLWSALGYTRLDDDEEWDLRTLVPPWSKQSDLFSYKDDKGNWYYVDLTFALPHSRPLDNIKYWLKTDDPWKQQTKEILDHTFGDFYSVDMVAGKLWEIFYNQKAGGGKVYNDKDPWKGLAMADHLSGPFTPGVLSTARRTYLGYKGHSDEFGEVYNARVELFSAIAGARVVDVDFERNLEFKVREFTENLVQDKRLAEKYGRSQARGSLADFKKYLRYAEVARRRDFDKFQQQLDALRRGGITDSQIAVSMKEAGVNIPTRGAILSGTYSPYNMSRERRVEISQTPEGDAKLDAYIAHFTKESEKPDKKKPRKGKGKRGKMTYEDIQKQLKRK